MGLIHWVSSHCIWIQLICLLRCSMNKEGVFGSLSVFKCEMKISPATPINKKSQPSAISGLQMWRLPKLRSSGCYHPPTPWWSLRSRKHAGSSHLPLLKVDKERGLAPESWSGCEGDECSEPRGLQLPIHRMLNSLTCYLLFDVQTACSFCCKLVYSLTSLPVSLEQFSWSYWDAVSPARSPKYSHQIK